MKKKNRNLGLVIFLIVWVVILFLPYFVMRPTIKNIQKDMAVRAEKFAIVKSNSYLCIEQKNTSNMSNDFKQLCDDYKDILNRYQNEEDAELLLEDALNLLGSFKSYVETNCK